jgi:phosphomannomutase
MTTEEQETIILTPEVVKKENLAEWAKGFKLGTAGYRDQLDPMDIDNPAVSFNRVKIAIIAEAKARVYERNFRGKGMVLARHVGGEVRPHTPQFIRLVARIYAAHGHVVHLRAGVETTPIWYSSFGVFYNELNDGENFTASHSPNFKGGWKPMDYMGKQLIQEAILIADEVRTLTKPGTIIKLAPPESSLIRRDFDVTEAYCEYLSSIVPKDAIDEIKRANRKGFTTYISTVGGAMARTTRPIFENFNIMDGIKFMHEEEDPEYHGIGIIDGENYGVDPGKWQIYKNVGAQAVLGESMEGNVFFIWDPDGDRFNVITTAPSEIREEALSYGLEVEDLNAERILVYFKPNQIYFMLTLLRIDQLRSTGELDEFDWVVAETFPTSRSIGEIAEKNNLKVIRTPVGFKFFGEVAGQIEAQLDKASSVKQIETPTGELFKLGKNPRILLMAEESGGAAMGGSKIAESKNGLRKSLVMKEKDGFQVGMAVMTLAARLFLEKRSFAQYYINSMNENDIKYRHYERLDVTLYDENLSPDKLPSAKKDGIRRRDRVVETFRGLVGRDPQDVEDFFKVKMPDFRLPRVKDVIWAGDGTLIEFDDMWWEVRASGTDAVLRYYIEGRDREAIQAVNRALAQIVI